MRRQKGLVEREPDGTWIIAPDHLERAAEFERSQTRSIPSSSRRFRRCRLDRQIAAEGATWLDRELDRRHAEHRYVTLVLAGRRVPRWFAGSNG